MIYELTYNELISKAEEYDNKVSRNPDKIEFTEYIEDEASARFYNMCAIAKKLNIPQTHPGVLNAERLYLNATIENDKLDFSSPGQRASRILKAVSELEKIILE